jgi:DNA-binding NtrC family response regulator
MKNLIISAHKDTYYTASALLLSTFKDADLNFTEADTVHLDLPAYADSAYDNIYIVGVRLKNDFSGQILAALKAVSAKKKIKWYVMSSRFDVEGPDRKLIEPYLILVPEGKTITKSICEKEKCPEEAFKRLDDLYSLCEAREEGKSYKEKLDNTKNYHDYLRHEIKMYWKWEPGNIEIIRDIIKKLAFNSVPEDELNSARPEIDESRVLSGKSPNIQDLRKKIGKITKYKKVPVLILGESGSGKEIVANMLHEASKRKGELIPVNCAGLSPALTESLLFGYVKGAFTDAKEDKKGIFAEANGGTVFLDEIASMDITVQAKLLRFLEDYRFTPLGAVKTEKSDVMIIAACNEDLRKKIKEGKFREDLYYRLSGVELVMPPLRERKEDIKEVAKVLAYRLYKEGYPRLLLNEQEYRILETYEWPGNARQLYKFLMRCAIMDVRGKDMKEELKKLASEDMPAEGSTFGDDDKITTMKDAEKYVITKALRICNGNKTKAASELGIVLNTLKNKIKEYGIKADESGDEK